MSQDRVRFVDLNAQTAELAEEISAAMQDVVQSSAFIGGEQVRKFEDAYADLLGVRHCVGVSNGTDALELALRACGVGPGDEVIIPANTFVATAEAVVRAGATPVLVDCDPVTLLIDVEQVVPRIGPRTRVVMPVHLYGQMAPMGRLRHALSPYPRGRDHRGRRPGTGCAPGWTGGGRARARVGYELLSGQEPRSVR